MTEEEWRSIPGYEGSFEVSSMGRIRRLDRIVHRKDGISYLLKGAIRKLTVANNGYPTVGLGNNNLTVHRLVAQAFIPNPENLPLVLHKDGDKRNPRVSNLRWGTYSDNAYDAVSQGVHGRASLTHCKNNHEFTPENTYIIPSTGSRQCRECQKVTRLAWYYRNPDYRKNRKEMVDG